MTAFEYLAESLIQYTTPYDKMSAYAERNGRDALRTLKYRIPIAGTIWRVIDQRQQEEKAKRKMRRMQPKSRRRAKQDRGELPHRTVWDWLGEQMTDAMRPPEPEPEGATP